MHTIYIVRCVTQPSNQQSNMTLHTSQGNHHHQENCCTGKELPLMSFLILYIATLDLLLSGHFFLQQLWLLTLTQCSHMTQIIQVLSTCYLSKHQLLLNSHLRRTNLDINPRLTYHTLYHHTMASQFHTSKCILNISPFLSRINTFVCTIGIAYSLNVGITNKQYYCKNEVLDQLSTVDNALMSF